MVNLAHSLNVKYLLSFNTFCCCISPTIIVPLSLFSNSIPFLSKEHFASSKIEKVRAFYRKSLRNWNINHSKFRKQIPQNYFGQSLSLKEQNVQVYEYQNMNIKITNM